MIQAMIFDLDGALVQTEKLKASSYAKAAVQMCPHSLGENDVIEAFKDVVGLSRREVAMALVDRFDLEEKVRAMMCSRESQTRKFIIWLQRNWGFRPIRVWSLRIRRPGCKQPCLP